MHVQKFSTAVCRGLAGAAVGLALLTSGCGGAGSEPTTAPAATSHEPALSVESSWVKAANEGMTAAFGVLVNDGTEDIRIVSAQSSASTVMELHEVTMIDGEMRMREKEGGFVVPAGGEHPLEPGADHLMMMDLTEPITPGDDVDIVLTLEDDSTFEFTAQAKEFAGGDEEYQPGEGHDG